MSAVDLQTHPSGVILPVQAHPGARKNEFKGVQNGLLKVSVTQVPEQGKANKAIVEFLAKGLKLRKSQITLLSGETSGQKKFLIEGITPEELAEKLRSAVG
ncbi:MAG: DUF167 domain-containing protein [Thermoguttaceae bacterium]|nr:DUF167 domain-containing protein [Thermoguttaceae bacterium]MBR2586095.1 DUF167 domain-containing protein [Thermoguttaceae bacterium]MBR3218799.1 DUF167 domain-containing protein [Thermoguttaceae bacterium]